MFFSTASEAKREVKSLISIKTSMNSENMGHLWHKMSRIYLKKLEAPCQISSYFWVFWGKIQLSNGHKVSWFWVGWKILLDLIFPHVGLSSMPFWSKYTDPPTSMICGINFFQMLNQKCWIKIEIYYGSKPIKVLYYELLRGKKTLKFCSKNQWRSKTTDLNEWNYVYWDPLDFLKKFGVCGPISSM